MQCIIYSSNKLFFELSLAWLNLEVIKTANGKQDTSSIVRRVEPTHARCVYVVSYIPTNSYRSLECNGERDLVLLDFRQYLLLLLLLSIS